MKKMIVTALLALSLSSNAFWNNNNDWWNGGYGWDDNGVFGYNSYDYWDPRWYFEEFENMMDEFDDNGWGNNNYYGGGYGPYGYGQGPYGPNGYGFPSNGYMMTPWGPGAVPANVAPVPVAPAK